MSSTTPVRITAGGSTIGGTLQNNAATECGAAPGTIGSWAPEHASCFRFAVNVILRESSSSTMTDATRQTLLLSATVFGTAILAACAPDATRQTPQIPGTTSGAALAGGTGPGTCADYGFWKRRR